MSASDVLGAFPAGCGAKIELIERLLRGTPAWETFLELTRGERGAPVGNLNNPTGANQHTEEQDERTNCDRVTVCPQAPNSPPPTGNSVSYALRRLKKHAPELYEQVKAK